MRFPALGVRAVLTRPGHRPSLKLRTHPAEARRVRFLRVLTRLRRRRGDSEGGFSLIEMVVAITVIFGALLMLMNTAMAGLLDTALARQRQSANAIANQLLEQVRSLPYNKVSQGLADADLGGDTNIVYCPDGEHYFQACGAERMAHAPSLAPVTPLVPHQGAVGPPTYPNTYNWGLYVTHATGVPQAGAKRVTAIVSWNPTVRAGASSAVRAQTLVYRPTGSFDPLASSTGSGFYGTSDLTRGSVKLTPNPGVSGGTGVSGLSSWDSVTQELPLLNTNITAGQLTQSGSQATLSGAAKSVGGVVSQAGGPTSVAKADDASTSSTPPGVSQGSTPTEITGGGNRIRAGEATAAAAPSCPAGQPNPWWMTGVETGMLSPGIGLFDSALGGTADSGVARNGRWSLKVNKVSGQYGYVNKTASGTAQVMSFGLRLASLPTTDVTLAWVLPSTGNSLYLGYQASTQKLTLRWGTQAPAVSSSAVSAGTWYSIDMRANVGTNPRTGDWRVDGAAQPSVSSAEATSTASALYWGSNNTANTQAFTANYDDLVASTTSANYPIGTMKVLPLRPDGMGTSASSLAYENNDGTAIDSTTWTRLDDDPMTSTADYVGQVGSVSGVDAYVEVNFSDIAEPCVKAVSGVVGFHAAGRQVNHGKTSVFDSGTETAIYNGDMSTTTLQHAAKVVTPAGGTWSQGAANGLRARVGYSSDNNPVPYWDSLLLEVAAAPASGGGGGGGTPGDESGSSAATVPPASPANCFATQTVGACGYAQGGYVSPAPDVSTVVNLGGSGAGDCLLYQRTADVGTSSTYGRRDTSVDPTGSVVEDVVHYYGAHQVGGLCAGTVTPPAGWAGYLVKYDPGGASSCVKAAAGIQAAFPRFCSVGTISYWNGSGVSTMSPSEVGASIPVLSPWSYTSNGWRYDVTTTLASAPSSSTQVPQNAPLSGTADRSDAKSTLGAPVTGTIDYKLTNPSGNVVVDLRMTVDLGSLTATAVYKP